MMKKIFNSFFILSFLILISLNSESKALDIKDFDIENIKIGDSIFNHFDERHVSSNLKKYKQGYDSKKYTSNNFKILSPKKYNNIQVHYNDDKIIGSVGGYILYRNNSEEHCAKQEKEVVNDILTSLPKKTKTKGRPGDKIQYRKYPGSYFTSTRIYVDGGSIRISCTYWEEKMKKKNNWSDNLRVTLDSDDFTYWLNNEAY